MSDETEQWDYDKAERRAPNKNARAVLSVAFSREDFERLTAEARQKGIPVSRLVRERALYWLYPPAPQPTIYVTSSDHTTWTGPTAPTTTGDGRDVGRALDVLARAAGVL